MELVIAAIVPSKSSVYAAMDTTLTNPTFVVAKEYLTYLTYLLCLVDMHASKVTTVVNGRECCYVY